MNSYEREAIGDIVIIKGLVFENTAIGKKEPDHAWKDAEDECALLKRKITIQISTLIIHKKYK